MSLPACFQFADASADARMLLTLDRRSYPAWRDAQTASVQAWLDGHGFDGSGGSFLVLPETDGQLRRVVVAIDDAGDPLALAYLPMLLPNGVYRLDAQSPLLVDVSAATLGWGLGAYQFARYVSAPKPVARLQLPEAAANSEAMALLSASLNR